MRFAQIVPIVPYTLEERVGVDDADGKRTLGSILLRWLTLRNDSIEMDINFSRRLWFHKCDIVPYVPNRRIQDNECIC